MQLKGRAIALYGRFTPGARDRLKAAVTRAGGQVARDLTRRSDMLVVGGLAVTLVDNGALPQRLASAKAREVPIHGERGFAAALSEGAPAAEPTLPLAAALGPTRLTREDVELLAAFDLVTLSGDACRFGDAGVIRTAWDLIDRGRSRGDVVRILIRARDLSPSGRHKIVLTPSGEAALQWDDGVTTLEGQGVLALDEDHPSLDDLFEVAAIAEVEGDFDIAARLYDQCARADRSDAISPYNYANIRLAQGAYDAAAMSYLQALARDPKFVEARYNLAQALEAAGKEDAAAMELSRTLDIDPHYADAVFNLAQLRMKAGEMRAAKKLYERFLALNPADEWAATARRGILYCATHLSA